MVEVMIVVCIVAMLAGIFIATLAGTKAGDRIDLVLPLAVQRVKPSEKIQATQGRVALKYGPLVYNIEQVDQDISRSLDSG